MGKRRVATAIVLVVGLIAPMVANGADPGLVGWWKFDGDGSDASGNGRDGTLMGNADFKPGHEGQALTLDGDGDYFTVNGWTGLMSSSPVTVTAWVQTTGNGTMVYWGRNSGTRRVDFRINGGRLRVEHGSGNLQGDTTLNDGEWHHVVLAMPANAPISYPEVKLYLDGRDDTRDTQDPDLFQLVDHASNVDVTVGYRAPNADRFFPGLIDDVRMYERVLGEAEIADVMELGYLASAHTPVPADGSRLDEVWVNLEWTPGPLAASHNVYFGTSFEDVNAGAEGTFVGNTATSTQVVGVANYPLPEGLVPGTTYYWRVEEVGDGHPESPWHGRVWSFWLPELTAFNPVPAEGEPFEDPNTDLSWALGFKGIFSNVYVGTDSNEVAGATGGPPHLETTYDPGPLALDTNYYWRVDTFDGQQVVPGPLWSFKTRPEIAPVGDPNFVAWWMFDEAAGTNALDRSGRGNHVKLFGATAWTAPGQQGDTALDLAEGGYGAINNLSYSDPNNAELTVAVWMRTSDPNDQYILSFDRNEYYRLEVSGNGAGLGRVGWDLMAGGVQIDYGSATRVDDGLWHHVCGVFDNGAATIYIDGIAEPVAIPVSGSVFGTTFGTGNIRYGLIGRNSEATEFDGAQGVGVPITGDIDDLRIYDRALPEAEILELMRVDPRQAWDLRPAQGRTVAFGTVTSLSWQAGDDAVKHDVYFGIDPNAAANADASDTTGVYRGQRSGTTYAPPEGLAWGQTYYWRIDEVGADGTIAKGRTHTFTVADYVTVEDFETYTNDSPDRVFQTWIDGLGYSPDALLPDGHPGNGSGAICGNDPAGNILDYQLAFSGRWCVPVDYNNANPPYYSEIERTWAKAQDWTVDEVEALTLHYTAGTLTDVTAQGLASLYVRVEDSAGRSAVAINPDPDAVRQVEWQAWSIPLADLTAAGVNTKAVVKMIIGIGDPDNPTPDGAGRLYFDAIRLTRSAPEAKE